MKTDKGVTDDVKEMGRDRYCWNGGAPPCVYVLGRTAGIVGESQFPTVGDAAADAPMPVMPEGESEASGYCELSGSGAPVWSCGTASLENTPA